MPRTPALASLLATGLLLAPAPPAARAQDLASFEQHMTIHVLKNGWTFLILQRSGTPTFSFITMADVGSAQEVPGITGLAHMFEHMAFMGSTTVGTRDYASEKKALGATEAAYQAYQAARLAPRPDPAEVEKLLTDFKTRQTEAARFVVADEYSDVIAREGGVHLNAYTTTDVTGYNYSLPVNKLELFCFLESERFLHPVFRQFYEQRDVVQEERRLTVDSQPLGRLLEQTLGVAFLAHSYRHPVVGYMSDLQSFTATDAELFFDQYYGPSNLITAIVGAVDPVAVVPLLDKYFGRIPERPKPTSLRTVEPPAIAAREVVLEDRSQPVYLEGYMRPAFNSPDDAAYNAMDHVLSGGNSSRLYRALVRDRKIATVVGSASEFPGRKYPHLWGIYVSTAPGATNAEVQAVVRAEIERLRREDVSERELARFRRRTRANLLQVIETDIGLAIRLADYQRLYGDWRELFRSLERSDRVTPADVRRVALKALRPANRVVARIEKLADPEPAATPTISAAPAKKEGTR